MLVVSSCIGHVAELAPAPAHVDDGDVNNNKEAKQRKRRTGRDWGLMLREETELRSNGSSSSVVLMKPDLIRRCVMNVSENRPDFDMM